ncbi:class I SAM-dependent methyltransferase [SAR86 cluster bacterium]|nr:class I SAM-dependent methyltransferase [SAR86 cluster bacterium]
MNYPYVSHLKIEDKEFAKKFADDHDLTFASPRQIRIASGIKPVIWVSKNKLQLQDLDDKNSKPFSLDFETLDKEKKSNNLLHKCFSKFDISLKVFDLTAGFCKDAHSIANMGFQVTAYEKESWLFEFNKTCLSSLKKRNLNLINLNSIRALKKVTKKDILFLDPMFEINSRASAKKEIQFLRKCISTSSEKEILDAAQKSSAGVIILKRHKLSNSQNPTKPSYVIKGKVISFEVFDRRAV